MIICLLLALAFLHPTGACLGDCEGGCTRKFQDASRKLLVRAVHTSDSSSHSMEIPNGDEHLLPQRADPLNGLKKYRGGYDIENKHYWASAAFTGIYGYAIGMSLFLVGTAVLFLLIVLQLKRRNEKVTQSVPTSFHVVFVVVFILATVIALIFCCVILAANRKLNVEARRIEATLIGAANDATGTIDNVTTVMSRISTTLQPYKDEFSASKTLFSTRDKLYAEGIDIQRKVNENKEVIDKTLRSINIAVIVLSSLTMLASIAGLAMMDFTTPVHVQWRSRLWSWLFSLITLLFWTLTIYSWFAFGLSYMSTKVVEDTCIALKEYKQDPYNNSLGALLPCVNLKTANESVLKMRESLYRVIIQANRNISRLKSKLDVAEDDASIPHICNPFSGPPHYRLTGECMKGTVTIGRVPEALKPFQCSQENGEVCVTAEGKRIPSSVYKTILAYSSAAETLIDATPSLESLTNCSFVVDAFSVIVDERCKPAEVATRMLWVSYAGVSTAAVVLLALYVRELYSQTVYLRVSAAAMQMPSPALPME